MAYDETVEMLREWSDTEDSKATLLAMRIGADAITALQARVAELTEERDKAVQRMKDGWIEVTHTPIKYFMDRAERAEADLDAARALLEEANPLLLPSGDDLSLRIEEALRQFKGRL